MCDQDHFDNDLEEYEKRGLVTRRQFGVLVGAGVSMMPPSVANAADVTESEVTITTPDGVADAPGDGRSTGRPCVAGHLRAAPCVPADG